MNRRHYLSLVSTSASLAVAGCASDSDDRSSTQTANVDPVTVSDKDYSRERAIHSLNVSYSTKAVSEFQPPDSYNRTADSGRKFLLIHADVSVESELDSQIKIYGSVIGVEANGIIEDSRSVGDLPSFTQTVTPGATYEAWGVCEIPEEATEATLIAVEPDAWFDQPTEIVFEPSSSLSATIPNE